MDIPLQQLLDDLARDLHPRDVIAARYSLTLQELHALISRPAVLRLYRERKAVWESSGSLEERARTYALLSQIELLPEQHRMATDPTEHSQVRVEAMKSIQRMIGEVSRGGQGGPAAGAQFAVNIYLGGPTPETISTTVVEHAPA